MAWVPAFAGMTAVGGAMTGRHHEAWGYIEEATVIEPLALVDRLLAMFWRMTQPQR